MNPILEAHGLGRTLPGERPVVLVHDVELTIERGCFTTIVGPSGCGKSSLLYLLGIRERDIARSEQAERQGAKAA